MAVWEIGDAPSDEDFNRIEQEIAENENDILIGQIHAATGTNTVVITTGGTFAYSQFSRIRWRQAANSTGAVTLNVDSNGTKALKRESGAAVTNLKSGRVYEAYFDVVADCFFYLARIEGDAAVENVLAGKTFSNGEVAGLVGTMPNNGVQVFEPLNVDRNLFGFYAQGSKIKAAHRVATGVKSLTSRLYLHVTGLSFRPSLVYAIRQSEIIDPPNFRAYVVAYYEGFWPTRYIYFNKNLGEMYIHSFGEGEGVFEGGFRIRVASNELPSGESYGWIAVE